MSNLLFLTLIIAPNGDFVKRKKVFFVIFGVARPLLVTKVEWDLSHIRELKALCLNRTT